MAVLLRPVLILVPVIVMALLGWVCFVIFFGYMYNSVSKGHDQDTWPWVDVGITLANLPFWLYLFYLPVACICFGLFATFGHWVLSILANISGPAISLILGTCLPYTALILVSLESSTDSTTSTDDKVFTIVGLVGEVMTTLSLMILMPLMAFVVKKYHFKERPRFVADNFSALPQDNSSVQPLLGTNMTQIPRLTEEDDEPLLPA